MNFTKEQLSDVLGKHIERERGLQELMELMIESMMNAEHRDFLDASPGKALMMLLGLSNDTTWKFVDKEMQCLTTNYSTLLIQRTEKPIRLSVVFLYTLSQLLVISRYHALLALSPVALHQRPSLPMNMNVPLK